MRVLRFRVAPAVRHDIEQRVDWMTGRYGRASGRNLRDNLLLSLTGIRSGRLLLGKRVDASLPDIYRRITDGGYYFFCIVTRIEHDEEDEEDEEDNFDVLAFLIRHEAQKSLKPSTIRRKANEAKKELS